jgi:hypothetical protein
MTLAHIRQAMTPAASARLRAATMRLTGRSKTARARKAGVPIGPGERVLAVDRGPGDSLVAATAAALYFGGQSEPGRTWCRRGWEEVTHVGWDDRRGVLALTGAGQGGMWSAELALERHSTLLELARERVSATLLASAVVRDSDRVCAVVMARRQPGTGTMIWLTFLNRAGDAENPAIRAKTAAAIADLRAHTGIPAE